MVKKLRPSSLDKKYLAAREYVAQPILNFDFKSIHVAKPWGGEYLIYANTETEVWNLYIKPQRSTSMHCHPNKRTALLILEGRALFSSLNESWELMPMDAMVIDPGVFHSTSCLSKAGLRLLEFETPPMKHDLVRLEDKYGRAQQGYEGQEFMAVDNTRIRFFGEENGPTKKFFNNNISIRSLNNNNDIIKAAGNGKNLAVILSGKIKNSSGDAIYSPANIINPEEIEGSNVFLDNVSAMIIGQ